MKKTALLIVAICFLVASLPAATAQPVTECFVAGVFSFSLGPTDLEAEDTVQGGPSWGSTCEEPEFSGCMSHCDSEKDACEAWCSFCDDCLSAWQSCADGCDILHCRTS